MASVEHRVCGVLLDLDDTIFPQSSWLGGAWDAVCVRAEAAGVERARLRRALDAIAADGTDRGRIIDRALAAVGADVCVADLVRAFRDYEAATLEPFPGVTDAISGLQGRAPVAVVTDGDPRIQLAKLRALRITHLIDHVMISDVRGRAFRKPHPLALLDAARAIDVAPVNCVMIGDRPAKDVAAAHRAGMRAIRVRTGEYASAPDDPRAWRVVRSLPDALALLRPLLARQGSAGPPVARMMT